MSATQPKNTSRTSYREKVILVAGYRKGDLLPGEEPLEELARLAETAGAQIVGRVVQNIKDVNPATFIGKGKVDEIKELAKRNGAQCILFDHDLQPTQGKNLDNAIELKVMDRTELILDIFASHARSRMATVQVGIALFEYRLPRLKRLWTHLERQTGGIGMRGGPGERQIEVDRRKIEKHLDDLKAELKQIEGRKERMVRSRGKDNFLVSLVGYTNAGKSTLMRSLTGEDVLVADKLFATLDTKTSLLKLGGGVQALLSDTVGFIRRLPHNLVGSFHATLEEARHADLLLHVVDVSSPLCRGQIEAVNVVLKEIGCDQHETLMVFNKADVVPPELEVDVRMLKEEYPEAITISALRKQGLEQLKAEIRERARGDAQLLTIAVHAGDGKLLSFLSTHFFEDERTIDGDDLILTGRASRGVVEKILKSPHARILKGWPGKSDAFPASVKKE